MIVRNAIISGFIAIVFCDCSQTDIKSDSIKLFKAYYTEVKDRSEDKWNYTTDTVKLWFDEKNGEPVIQVKGNQLTGRWIEWDEEMNATSYYDSLWFDMTENAVKGFFYENNDFYTLIGKSPTKTLRTYWMNDHNKIDEILIYWIPEDNTMTSEHLGSITEWAMKNDSLEIQALYPEGRIIPSRENAIRWKELLSRYKEANLIQPE